MKSLIAYCLAYREKFKKEFGDFPKSIIFPHDFYSNRTLADIDEFKQVLLYYPPKDKRFGMIFDMEIELR